MSRNTIELNFANGEYTFALPAPRIDELQRKTGAGVGALFARLLRGVVRDPITQGLFFDARQADFYWADIVETIRQGLIGGGRGVVDEVEVKVTPVTAEQLVKNYVLDRPLVESWEHAVSIIGACVNGYEPPKKNVPAPKAGDRPKSRKKAGSTTVSF